MSLSRISWPNGRTRLIRRWRKAEKRFGDAFNKEQFPHNQSQGAGNIRRRLKRPASVSMAPMERNDLADVKETHWRTRNCLSGERIAQLDRSPPSLTWCSVPQMDRWVKIPIPLYLRPETARESSSITWMFKKTGRMKIPFGIAQIGKAFREWNRGPAIHFPHAWIRTEWKCPIFCPSGNRAGVVWKMEETRLNWQPFIGHSCFKISASTNMRKLAHYANAAVDIEFWFP